MQLFARTVAAIMLAASSATTSADVVTDWNQVALKATEIAGMPPPVQARAMAIVHAAIYDAVNALDQRHKPYVVTVTAPGEGSVDDAAAAAAHGALVRLFPLQRAMLDTALSASPGQETANQANTEAAKIGREVAEKLIALRKSDGADEKAGYSFSTGPGVYEATPPANAQPVLPHWGKVKPFLLQNAAQFEFAAPPDSASAEFAKHLLEVKTLGSKSSTERTNEQTAIAIHWAGSEITPMNAIARSIATAHSLSVADNARMFALLNMAMADALIAVFDAKYRFNTWRPVTAIRAVAGDAAWEPLIVTPPHPSYPSAHTAAVGAAEVVLRQFAGGDKINASYVYPPLGVLRRWGTLSQISKEVEDARVWGGIHFRFSSERGTEVGRRIGEYALKTYLQPVSG